MLLYFILRRCKFRRFLFYLISVLPNEYVLHMALILISGHQKLTVKEIVYLPYRMLQIKYFLVLKKPTYEHFKELCKSFSDTVPRYYRIWTRTQLNFPKVWPRQNCLEAYLSFKISYHCNESFPKQWNIAQIIGYWYCMKKKMAFLLQLRIVLKSYIVILKM